MRKRRHNTVKLWQSFGAWGTRVQWHSTDVQQPICGFHQDEQQHWVAELRCGHNQHVRHDPPWTLRPWVVSEAGRQSKLGQQLVCKKCQRGEPADRY